LSAGHRLPPYSVDTVVEPSGTIEPTKAKYPLRQRPKIVALRVRFGPAKHIGGGAGARAVYLSKRTRREPVERGPLMALCAQSIANSFKTFHLTHRQLLPFLVKTLCKWNRSQKSAAVFCDGGGEGDDKGNGKGKGVASGKALIGSTGTGAGVVSAGNWSDGVL
jgi:hypothetical protein